MSRALRSSSSSIILVLAISFISDRGSATEKKAAVGGGPPANLRARAGGAYALKLTLKEGEHGAAAKPGSEWFLIAAADVEKSSMPDNLSKVADETPGQASPTPIPIAAATQAKEPAKEATTPAPAVSSTYSKMAAPPKAAKSSKIGTTPTPTAVEPERTADGKSQSILKLLEAHEAEVKIAALVATIAFVLGWFCGGSYYIRRERKARRRLRF